MKWLTVASVVLDDGKHRILFDPAFTRPTWKHWLNIADFVSDEELVKKVLKDNSLAKIDALFASHSHFDHVIDAPTVAKLTGGTFFADSSQLNIAKAYKDPGIKLHLIKDRSKIQVGDFTILVIKQTHPEVLGLFPFLPGPVNQDFDFSFYDYRMGDTWLYVVIHPEGTIIIDQGPDYDEKAIAPIVHKVDAVIQGIAARDNDEVILNGYLKAHRPSAYVLNHFDNFFLEMNAKEESLLPGVGLAELQSKIASVYPDLKVIKPMYGEKIVLLKGTPKSPR